jgi:hypothetical protein
MVIELGETIWNPCPAAGGAKSLPGVQKVPWPQPLTEPSLVALPASPAAEPLSPLVDPPLVEPPPELLAEPPFDPPTPPPFEAGPELEPGEEPPLDDVPPPPLAP